MLAQLSGSAMLRPISNPGEIHQAPGTSRWSCWRLDGLQTLLKLCLYQARVLSTENKNCSWACERKSEKWNEHTHNPNGELIFCLVPPKLALPILLISFMLPCFLTPLHLLLRKIRILDDLVGRDLGMMWSTSFSFRRWGERGPEGVVWPRAGEVYDQS